MTPSRTWTLVSVALGTALIAGLLGLTGALRGPEHESLDLRFAVRGAQPSPQIALVAIDDQTIHKLGDWPFSRTYHARMVDKLHAAGVREIVYDVQFTEATKPAADFALFNALGRAGGAVLSTTVANEEGRTTVLGGDANLRRIHAVAAAANVPADDGGVLRRYARAIRRLPTVPVAVARRLGVAPGGFDGHGQALIDYRGGPGTVFTLRFSDVLDGTADASRLRGRVVVVGATAPSLHDVHPTSVAGQHVMSGAEVQANAIWTALHGNPLQPAPWWAAWLAVLALAALPAVAIARLAMRWALPLIVVAGVAYAGAAVLAFSGGTVLVVVAPLLALVVSTVGLIAAGYVTEATARRVEARLTAALTAEVAARTQELRDTQLEIVHRLAEAAERRDDETGAHLERIGAMTYRLALATGMDTDAADLIRHASAMHDVGKIGIPDSVLRKPGKLDADEWEVMKSHPALGARILAGSNAPLVQLAEEIARTHHERWDGSGYPAGLAGKAIPLAGRICAICDVFDALLSERPYKRAWSVDEARAEIATQRGAHFDPALTDRFLELVDAGEFTAGRTLTPT